MLEVKIEIMKIKGVRKSTKLVMQPSIEARRAEALPNRAMLCVSISSRETEDLVTVL